MLPAFPSFRQLAYLLALREHRHFGRAAAACFVTQSTLSVGIAELERLLGATLVERSKRSIRFTPVGEEVAARARGMLRAGEDLIAVAQDARAPLAGTLRLAAIPTIAPFVLPQMLPRIALDWPDLKLLVREMLTAAACEAMHRGTIDCVLLALPVDCGDIESFAIRTDRLLLAAPAAEDVPAAFAEVDGARLLLLEDGHCLKDHALAACDLSRRAPDATLVASTLHTLVQLVDARLGVTLLPEMAVSAGILAGTDVRAHALAGMDATREVALVWRKGHARAADLRLLGETILAASPR